MIAIAPTLVRVGLLQGAGQPVSLAIGKISAAFRLLPTVGGTLSVVPLMGTDSKVDPAVGATLGWDCDD